MWKRDLTPEPFDEPSEDLRPIVEDVLEVDVRRQVIFARRAPGDAQWYNSPRGGSLSQRLRTV